MAFVEALPHTSPEKRRPFLQNEPLIRKIDTEQFPGFLERIGMQDLGEKITHKEPWSYWTMEVYRQDIKGQGGLGMLASDTLEQAKRLGFPMIFYNVRKKSLE